MNAINWRSYLWLLLSTVVLPAMATLCVGVLILVFYEKSWDVAFGVLVLCFGFFVLVGSVITVFLLRRTAELSRLQSEFIANISHDFRTPLTSIRMFVDTLRGGKITDPEQRRQCLDLLAQESERMERLVERVLTWRSQERTGGGYRLQPERLDPLLQRALAPFRLDEQIERRLDLVCEPHLPRILADSGALMEAVRNLVENGLKYSGDGQVVVTARSDGEGVAISVRDHGTTIPPREQKRIFERFYRVPGTDTSGTGLGLAIARHVARAHEGDVEVKSSEAAGNVFTIRLRLALPAEDADRAAKEDDR